MRKIDFYVPETIMADFAEELSSSMLPNRIAGKTDDNKIIIEVEYEKDESDMVDGLEDYLDELMTQ
jgi:hypothetical protein